MDTVYTFVLSPGHKDITHPESPTRFSLLDKGTFPAEELPTAPATLPEIGRVHTPGMIEHLQAACRQGPAIIDSAPTFVTQSSFGDALDAAGATLAATRAVLRGEARNAFALVRPPGHHAEPQRSMGFCLFNNVAVAVKDALTQTPGRLLVVDYDAHHGNGTERAFWDDERAGYFSTHQEHIYPGSGWLQDAPHARGRIADFPLAAYSGDQDFALIFEQALRPLVEAFRPQMMLVSAGFDAHWRDPLTSLGLSSAGYYHLSRRLVDLAEEFCSGKIVFVLEGGYDPENVANGVGTVFAALTGSRSPHVTDACPHPEPDVTERIAAFRKWHGI